LFKQRNLTPSCLGLVLSAGALLGAPPDLGPAHAFTPRAQWTDELGQTHIRYVHRYQGLRVWGSEMIEHLGPGAAQPTLNLKVPSALPPRAPVPLAALALTGEAILWPDLVDVPVVPDPDAELMDHQAADFRNALYIQAPASAGDDGDGAWDFVVDADTGEVLEQIPIQETQAAAKGVGNSLFRGRVTLDTTSVGGAFQLQDLTRGANGPFGHNFVADAKYQPGLGSVYANPTNLWGDGHLENPNVNTSSANGQTMAVDMAAGMADTWDYYLRIHNRMGVDGLGTAIRGVAHAGGGVEEDNAEWTPRTLTFSVLKPVYRAPYSYPVIIAHELTHGVTEYTADLVYQGESGGLNEATSDIFGTMVTTWVRNGKGATIGNQGTNWTLPRYQNSTAGLLNPGVLRSFIKPSTATSVTPNAWSATLKNIDVHYSSGPMNRAFYFLSQGSSSDPAATAYSQYLPQGMAGVGNDAAARIWYRALVNYLTPASTFADARTAALEASTDLFNAASPETAAVARAFAAINVGSPDLPAAPAQTTLTATATLSGPQLTLAATSPGAVDRVLFYVDGINVGSAPAPSFSLSLDSGSLFANGGHTLIVKAFTAAGLVATAPDVPFTLANPTQQLLANPGFEGGRKGWTRDVNVISFDPTGVLPHGGYRWARFAPQSGLLPPSLATTVNVPAGAPATLSYWVRVPSDAPAGGSGYFFRFLSAAGGLSDTKLIADSSRPRGQWLQATEDLTSYAGKTVSLSFSLGSSPGSNVTFDLDDVRIISGALPTAAITVTPASLSVYAGTTSPVTLTAQVTGAASNAVTWTAVGGGILVAQGAQAQYTPPRNPGSYSVLAQSAASPSAMATVPVLVKPLLAFSPASATVEPGASLTLTLDIAPGVTPALTLGSPQGGTFQVLGDPTQILYTAPSGSAGTFLLTARDPVSGYSTSAALTVPAVPVQVSVSPAQVNLATGAGCQFTATVLGDPSGAVIWAIQEGSAGGTLSPQGLYAAPTTPGTYHVVATSSLDPSRSAVATVTVQAALAINPPQATLLTGATFLFTTSAPGYGYPNILWTLAEGTAAGSITAGSYTAPATPGTYTVVATSASDPTQTAQALVTVKTTDLNGNGATLLDFGDLALFADAYGTGLAAADFNGDGVVDDLDATLFLSRFGGE